MKGAIVLIARPIDYLRRNRRHSILDSGLPYVFFFWCCCHFVLFFFLILSRFVSSVVARAQQSGPPSNSSFLFPFSVDWYNPERYFDDYFPLVFFFFFAFWATDGRNTN